MHKIEEVIRPKRRAKLYVYGVLLVFLAALAWIFLTPSKEVEPHYNTTSPSLRDISTTISATGTLNPLNEVQIGSQISGIIAQLFVDANEVVKKGQVLAKIDDQKILQELKRNQAQLKEAQAQILSLKSTAKDKQWQFERLQKLYKQSKGKYPSYADVQNAEVAYEIARAEILAQEARIEEIQTRIKSTQIDYDNTIITSPIDGMVLVRSIDVGQTVAASFSAPELFRVAQSLEEMKLVVKIAESDIGQIRLGQQVSFGVDAYPNRSFAAVVDKINFASSVTDNIVSYEVSINVKNPDLLLRPGMSATANIKVAEAKSVLSLPVAALYFSPKGGQGDLESSRKMGKSVWILIAGKPQEREIRTGISDGRFVEIEGLGENAEVILQERGRL